MVSALHRVLTRESKVLARLNMLAKQMGEPGQKCAVGTSLQILPLSRRAGASTPRPRPRLRSLQESGSERER